MSNIQGGVGNVNINVGSVSEAGPAQSPAAAQASSSMQALDPLTVLAKVAEILKGVLGAKSG